MGFRYLKLITRSYLQVLSVWVHNKSYSHLYPIWINKNLIQLFFSLTLNFPMRIPKCWRSTEGTSRRPCLSSASIWRTTNLCTSRIYKDLRKRRRPSRMSGNIHEWKSLSNIIFIHCKFLIWKIQEDKKYSDHVNKVKELVDQPAYLEVSVRYEDIVMTLLKSLLTSYEYLITTLEMMSMKELMMDYVMAHLWTIYRSVQRRSPKVRIQPWCCGKTKGTIHFHAYTQMLCFYYGKPGHIVHFCYKPKNNERKKYKECERRW